MMIILEQFPPTCGLPRATLNLLVKVRQSDPSACGLHVSLFKQYFIAGNADNLRAELCMYTVGKVACRCKFLYSTTPNEILSSSTVDLWVCINLENLVM